VAGFIGPKKRPCITSQICDNISQGRPVALKTIWDFVGGTKRNVIKDWSGRTHWPGSALLVQRLIQLRQQERRTALDMKPDRGTAARLRQSVQAKSKRRSPVASPLCTGLWTTAANIPCYAGPRSRMANCGQECRGESHQESDDRGGES